MASFPKVYSQSNPSEGPIREHLVSPGPLPPRLSTAAALTRSSPTTAKHIVHNLYNNPLSPYHHGLTKVLASSLEAYLSSTTAAQNRLKDLNEDTFKFGVVNIPDHLMPDFNSQLWKARVAVEPIVPMKGARPPTLDGVYPPHPKFNTISGSNSMSSNDNNNSIHASGNNGTTLMDQLLLSKFPKAVKTINISRQTGDQENWVGITPISIGEGTIVNHLTSARKAATENVNNSVSFKSMYNRLCKKATAGFDLVFQVMMTDGQQREYIDGNVDVKSLVDDVDVKKPISIVITEKKKGILDDDENDFI